MRNAASSCSGIKHGPAYEVLAKNALDDGSMRPQRSWTTSYVCAGSSICIRSDRGERQVCQAENAGSKDPAYTSVT
jgi:hypothetical protein